MVANERRLSSPRVKLPICTAHFAPKGSIPAFVNIVDGNVRRGRQCRHLTRTSSYYPLRQNPRRTTLVSLCIHEDIVSARLDLNLQQVAASSIPTRTMDQSKLFTNCRNRWMAIEEHVGFASAALMQAAKSIAASEDKSNEEIGQKVCCTLVSLHLRLT